MKYYQIFWIDSALTLAIAIYLIFMGWDLLKNSTRVLMLFTPEEIPVKEIVKKVNNLEEVKSIHHIHIWQLNEEEIHLEAHVDFYENIKLSEFDVVLDKIEKILFNDYNINHVNIQPEFRKIDPKDVIVQD